MKTNWQTRKLDEVCDFYNGLWRGKKPPYVEVGVIRNTNFTKDGELDDADIAYLEVEKKQFENRKLTYGDIILEKSGGGPKQPVGRVVIFNKKEGDFSFSNFTSAIRVKKSSELYFNFLYRFLFFSYISGITEKMQSHSTGIRNLDLKLYKNIELPLPPISEQKRIVKILDETFEKIEKVKENAEKNLRNSKELFESYLQSIFANPGNDWTKNNVGEFLKLEYGKPLDKKDRCSSGQYPVYGANGEKDRTDKFYYDKSTIVIGRKGSAGELNLTADKFWPLDVTYFVTFDDKKHDLKFIYFLLLTLKLTRLAKGVKPGINRNDVYSINVFTPSLKEQKSIVAKLDKLSAETKKLELAYKQKLADLEELKKSILKKAFKGEL